jgi:transposase-like protein
VDDGLAMVQRYGPELEQRLRRHLKPTNKSWRFDETYLRIKGHWCYLYRAIDSAGATIDFLLSALRDADATKRLFRNAFNIVEQDHHAIKRRLNAKQGFREFQAARRTIQGYEAMNMMHIIRKGQVQWLRDATKPRLFVLIPPAPPWRFNRFPSTPNKISLLSMRRARPASLQPH